MAGLVFCSHSAVRSKALADGTALPSGPTCRIGERGGMFQAFKIASATPIRGQNGLKGESVVIDKYMCMTFLGKRSILFSSQNLMMRE